MNSRYQRAAAAVAMSTFCAVSITAAVMTTVPAGLTAATGHEPTGIVYVDDVCPRDSAPRKSLTVDCPGVTYLVGAGFEAGEFGGNVRIERVVPSVDSLTVVAEVDETGPRNTSWALSANLVCADRPPGHHIVPQPSASSSGEKNAIASCDDGEEALGGGFRLPDTNGQLSVTRLDVGTSSANATVFEDDTGYAPNWAFTTYAICAHPISGRQALETNGDQELDGQTEQNWCDEGKAALSAYGGFDGGEGNVYLSHLSTFLLPQFGDASGSYTTGNDDDDGTTLDHDMYGGAICVDG